MKNEIIKQAFKLGNSAGVLLPREWNGRKVIVKLIDKSITEEVLEMLEKKDLLGNVIGIYLVGSYAREEEKELSDIDILIITDSVNKQIKIGKYELFIVSKERFDKSFVKSLYLASLVNEARAILNYEFIKSYKEKLKEVLVKKHLDEIRSITKLNEKSVEIDLEMGEKVSDGTIYSIVLRLRELYLIKCLKQEKIPLNKEFIGIVRKVASDESYNAYYRIKSDLKSKKVVSGEEALSLIKEIKKRVKQLEHGKKR